MLLAGDIGGTKALLGLFEPHPVRPRPIAVRRFATADHADLPALVRAFTAAVPPTGPIDAACFGVAGPVVGRTATLTNGTWRIDADAVARACSIARVTLLNDLQALAYAIPVLSGAELQPLQRGEPGAGGNRALIAAGTGLGEALLHAVDGRLVPAASEGGHADFAARTEREVALLRDLVRRVGRAEVEAVLSGPGLVNLHRVTHETPCAIVTDGADPDAPAKISAAALARRCAGCEQALDMFVDAYGAEAGNLALRSMATGGVFIGGGIAPKILPALTDGRFIRAFRDKPPFTDMLTRVPVQVIVNAEAGLLGAAVFAAGA